IKSIGPAIGHVRQRFPKQGFHDVKQTLLQEEQLMVPRLYISFSFNEFTLIAQFQNLNIPVHERSSRHHRPD
ncbi:hypothetical protein EV424DRAFT_1290527, partial [Suillus variegatus]